MSYPYARYLGDTGEISAKFRPADQEPELTIGSGTAANAKMSDVAKITLLIVDHDKERFRVMTEGVERVWGDNKPAMTLIPACPRPCA